MNAPDRRAELKRLVYRIVGGMLAAVVAVDATIILSRVLAGGGEVCVTSQPTTMVTTVDPNVATVEELAALPGISRAVAEAIVAYREEKREAWERSAGASASSRPAEISSEGRIFHSIQDLDAVRGVGPKTLERLGPVLRFGEEK